MNGGALTCPRSLQTCFDNNLFIITTMVLTTLEIQQNEAYTSSELRLATFKETT